MRGEQVKLETGSSGKASPAPAAPLALALVEDDEPTRSLWCRYFSCNSRGDGPQCDSATVNVV